MSSYNSGSVKREEKGRNIQVVVRCRPFNTVERKSSYGVIDCDPSRKEVVVRTGGMNDRAARKTYTFDMVFGPAAKQIDVYRSVVCPILDEVIMGYNCTVFAYGQTGTGKTFTMEGERTSEEQFTWEQDPLAGIIPRTLHQIFEKLSENGTEFSIKVSLLEIYNEELFDLLSPTDDVNEKLQLFDDPRNKRGVVVKGLEEVAVHSKDEVYQILERGSARRRTASTRLNAYSSRSHSVFSITIHMKEITLDGEELVKIGKLNLVDLAGSENIGRSGAVDKRAREAGNINQSLLTLGRVITALVEKRPHVPYRESKLTRILQDSLGGRTKTSIIATVSPSSSNMEETLSTLEYATRAKNIMNKPEINQKLSKRMLIKEYTEEIERLKHDLFATREKNGVYLSSENYESMMSQITCHDEQMSEYTDRITAMEDELQKVSELFEDSKSRLEQCTVVLEEKQQRLEETNRDLQQTKDQLTQEELVCSEVSLAHESLYNTADQLLCAAESSSGDVSGLHDKLDRKKKVEQHNLNIQQTFSQRIDGAFSTMEDHVQQLGAKHWDALSSYSQAVDHLLVMNEDTVKATMSTVQSCVDKVRELVAVGVARCRDRVQQQEALCVQSKDVVLQLLEEHLKDMEQVLVGQTLADLSTEGELSDALGTAVETQRVLASKVEAMKETGVFFSGLARDLAKVREETLQGLKTLQAENDQQAEEIKRAQERQQTRMQQTMQCIQDQLHLLNVEVQKDYGDLHSASRALQEPLQNLQEDIRIGHTSLERQASDQADLLSSTSSSLAASLHLNASESQQTLDQMSDCRRRLHSGVLDLMERQRLWSSQVQENVETQTQKQLSVMAENSSEVQSLKQSVDGHWSEKLQTLEEQLFDYKQEVTQALGSLQNQTSQDRTALGQQQECLCDQMDSSRQLVRGFLQEELQQDVPTGSTPQRRQFVYPRVLVKSRSRAEILESLRKQQEALTEEEEEEEVDGEDRPSQDSHDSLEEEMSCNDENVATESSWIDENLVFIQNQRVPFFKKKAAKKDKKIQIKPNDSVPKSRLPLHCQN